MTEIYDYLRLLFSKLGQIECPDCSIPVNPQSLDSICARIMNLEQRTKVMVLANLVSAKKGKHEETFESVRKERLVRVRVDGEIYDIEELPELSAKQQHTIDAVTDRIMVRDGVESRLRESVEMAVSLSGGSVIASFCEPDSYQWSEEFYSTSHACPQCGFSCPDVLPRTFSFNSPFGACPDCEGLGSIESFDTSRLIPDLDLPVSDAVVLWQQADKSQKRKMLTALKPLMKQLGIDAKQPLSALSSDQRQTLLQSTEKKTPGLLTILRRELATSLDEDWLDALESFRGQVACAHCRGTRLNSFANSIKIDNHSISDLCALDLQSLHKLIGGLKFAEVDQEVASTIVEEIQSRLQYLIHVGLAYLSLDRSSDSLSGGELQRVRLAKSIGSGLTGACYVLDEPSIGLHQRDNDRLIQTIQNLQQRGNSVIVVEHDESMMQCADHLIDVGPDAGQRGGRIVFEGEAAKINDCDQSLTAEYLSGKKQIHRDNLPPHSDKQITVCKANGNNLKNIDVQFQLGRFNCVCGVSGSGKSTLVYHTLAPMIKRHLELSTPAPQPCQAVTGLDQIDRFVEVDQRPISRNPRGCAATYTGIFADIRKIFAATKSARQLGYSASRFSFNTKQGWCSECEGRGVKTISMKFMPDVHVVCEGCRGQRFNPQTLTVRFRDLNIAEVLGLAVSDALDYFSEFSDIHRRVKALNDVGLGYLTLGQRSSTLSGGEAQRIKLAAELAKTHQGHALYLLDEPTTGLHFHDVQLLLDVLGALVNDGHSVIVIEHHLDVIRCSDWVVEIGPEGGDAGGQLVGCGSPTEISQLGESHTGRCLRASG